MVCYIANSILIVLCYILDKEMFTEMVEMLNGAWLLVKGHLSTHGKLTFM